MIFVALTLITLMVLTSSVISLRAQRDSNASLDSVQREIRVALDIVDAINHTRTTRTWLAQAALAESKGNEALADVALKTAVAKMKLSKVSEARYLDLPKGDAEKALAQEFKNEYGRYVDGGVAPLIDALRHHDLSTYQEVLANRTQVLDRNFEKALDNVLGYRERQARALNERIKQDFLINVVTLGGLAIGYVVVVVLLWRFAKKTLSLPLKEMADALKQFADKRFTHRLPPLPAHTPSEVSMIGRCLTVMQVELSDTVRSIRDSADSVRIASTEIFQATQDLARRTEAQAHQLQTSSAALQDMSQQIRTTSNASEGAMQAASDAARVASEGGQRVTRVVQTMASIQEASQRIGIIVSTIDALAFQTNILALNAAVEAARAGEHGRGFAVVAAEVRTLAQRSADAAKEIKHLIDDTLSRIAAGSTHAVEAGDIIRTLVGKVHSASQSMEGVKSSIVAQSEEIDNLSDAMTRLDMMTQQNAAMVEENAAASESLTMLATALAACMADFRTLPKQPVQDSLVLEYE